MYKKTILSLILALVLLAIPSQANAAAPLAEQACIPQTANLCDDLTNEIYVSPEYKRFEEDKLRDALANPLRNDSHYLSIPHYNQDNTYFCGPACVQIVAKYVTGNYYSQSTLANYMGTNASNGTYVYQMARGLRNYAHSQYGYSNLSERELSVVFNSINRGWPVVYHVMTGSLGSGYTFNSGHYIVGYGYSSLNYGTDNYYSYYDPWYGPGIQKTKTLSEYQMKRAINANAGYFLW